LAFQEDIGIPRDKPTLASSTPTCAPIRRSGAQAQASGYGTLASCGHCRDHHPDDPCGATSRRGCARSRASRSAASEEGKPALVARPVVENLEREEQLVRMAQRLVGDPQSHASREPCAISCSGWAPAPTGRGLKTGSSRLCLCLLSDRTERQGVGVPERADCDVP
jgi:hypothetical protein